MESGKLLDLDFKTGASIKVEGWDKDIVSVDAYLGGDDWEDINLNFNQTSCGIDVTTDYEGHAITEIQKLTLPLWFRKNST